MKRVNMKAQLEFVIIIGLIIIAVAFIILISTQLFVPSREITGYGEEIKSITNSVKKVLKESLEEAIIRFYNAADYTTALGSIENNGISIPLWRNCGAIEMPDINNVLSQSMRAVVRQRIDERMEFYGKELRFDINNMKIEVEIVDGRVIGRVYLPTEINNRSIPQPYVVSVESDMKNVINTAEMLLEDSNRTNFFETLTIASMLQLNPYSSSWIPVKGIIYGCGKNLFFTREKIADTLKGVAKYVASHTVVSSRTLRLADNPFFEIDIPYNTDVLISYPEGWDIRRYLSTQPDPVRIIPKSKFPMLPFCIANYLVSYTFRYPLIISIKDKKMGQWLSFATMVSIHANRPGQCPLHVKEGNYTRFCINNANCFIRLRITDTDGMPIKGAKAFFYKCMVGESDEYGAIAGMTPCMASELKVYKAGYTPYGNLTTPRDCLLYTSPSPRD